MGCFFLTCRTVKIDKFFFVQLTFRIESEQRFAVYKGSKGKGKLLVVGDPTTKLDVVDYWVFERKVVEPFQGTKMALAGSKWRLAFRNPQAGMDPEDQIDLD